jgi:zinc transporter 1/2/3
MLSSLQFRFFAACGILLMTVVAGFGPLQLSSSDPAVRAATLAHFGFFTGGVFMGAGLLHMLPDAITEAAGRWQYPVPFVLACLGFFLIWSLDKINVTNKQVGNAEIVAVATGATQTKERASVCYVHIAPVTVYEKSPGVVFQYGSRPHNYETFPEAIAGRAASSDIEDAARSAGQRVRRKSSGCSSGDGAKDDDHKHDEHFHHVVIAGGGLMFPLLLALVFSIHSFIEGLALGVQTEVNAASISILVAVVSHKIVEALTVGANFVKEKVNLKQAVPVIAVYCLMTPLGIFVGTLLTTRVDGPSSKLIQCILQSIASGSFIYLCIHEIADHDNVHNVKAWNQVWLFALGLGAMALLAVWV